MNLLRTAIKICSGNSIWLPNKFRLTHRQELTFAMVEEQLYYIVINVIHQLHINPIHQSIQSKLFSKFEIT